MMLLPQTTDDRATVHTEIQNLLYPPTPLPTPTPSVTPKKTPRPTPTPSPTPSPTPDRNAEWFIDGTTLYVQGSDAPEAIASNVARAMLSEDGQKLMWSTGSQIWVYWLHDQGDQPFHKAGDMATVGRMSHVIQAVAWFRDSDHIVVDAGGFKVIEIDTRGGQNIVNM